jgi:hypothetical protein
VSVGVPNRHKRDPEAASEDAPQGADVARPVYMNHMSIEPGELTHHESGMPEQEGIAQEVGLEPNGERPPPETQGSQGPCRLGAERSIRVDQEKWSFGTKREAYDLTARHADAIDLVIAIREVGHAGLKACRAPNRR